MPCSHLSGPGASVFSCGARRPARVCAWPLRGPKAGQTCGRDARHRTGSGEDLCDAHLRIWERRGRPALATVAEEV